MRTLKRVVSCHSSILSQLLDFIGTVLRDKEYLIWAIYLVSIIDV
nr:MAG TPA: hypothetical protein [Caudoviricetes sp.]